MGSTPGGAPVCAFPASAALKPIKLTRTAKGWSAFEMLFKAHLGSQLSASLNMAMVNKMMVATDARQAALFKHIFDRLVIALENETDLIESIAENCMADNGIEAFLHIKQLMVGQSTASSIMGIDKIITASIGSNTHVDASAIVSTNASLADDSKAEAVKLQAMSAEKDEATAEAEAAVAAVARLEQERDVVGL